MVGKNKGQRTKNNARPSSSGRSAELLSSQLPNLKDIGFLSPLMKNEEFDPSINSDFQIVFKRMNKKDSTTKLKALQEFSDLVNKSEPEAIKLILNFWCRIYTSLATDIDHRIREAVQYAHYQIILKDKKMLAAIIKQIIGAWFTSQYDTYPPAASIAMKSFQTTFPDEKMQNCLLFCHKEILSFIKQNLIEFSNYNGKCNDTDEAKLERMILSSLQGYCMYLQVLNSEQIEKQIELNQDIITNLLTQKFLKHKLPLIRSSCYQIINRLLQKTIKLLDNKQIINNIIDNLDDNDPTVIPYLWETFLLFIDIVENWWSFINFDKQFLKKFWSILQKGGQGCANLIYPNFLMLLTKLPPLKDMGFYDRFFENLRQGLDQRSVKMSKSESATIVITFIECMKYVILTHHSNLNFCEKLIKRHLYAFLQHNFKETCNYNQISIQQITFLIQYWYRNRNDYKNYQQYLEYLKNTLEKLFETSLSELETCDRNETKLITDKLKLFISTLKNPYEKFNKSGNRVKFNVEEIEENREVIDENPVENVEFTKNLTDLVYMILKSYFKIIEQRQLTILIDDSIELIRLFDNYDFLINLNNCLTDTDNKTGDLNKLYDCVITWLNLPGINRNLIDFVFILYKYSNSDEKSRILQELKNCKGDCLAWCIINAISPQFSGDSLIKTWLLDEKISDYLLEIVEESIENEWHPYLETILDSITSRTDLPIKPKTFEDIIGKLQKILNNSDDYETTTIESVANLTSFLLNRIGSNSNLLTIRQELSLTIFSFMCSREIPKILNENNQELLKTSFLNCLQTNKTQEFYLEKLANILQEKFLNCHKIDYFTTIIYDLLEFLQYDSSIFRILFKFDLLDVWREQLLKICEYCKFLIEPNKNQLKFSCLNNDIDFNNFVKYSSWSTLKLSIFHQIYKNDKIDQIETLVNWSEILLDFHLLGILIDNYKTVKDYKLLKQNYNLMNNKIEMFKQLVNDDDFRDNLIDDICKYPEFWARILAQFSINSIEIDKNHFKSVDFEQISGDQCQEFKEMFDKIDKFRDKDTAKFLLQKSVLREEFQEILRILQFFSDFTSNDSVDFPIKPCYWDLIVISLSSWSTSCFRLKQDYNNIELQTFFIGLTRLFINLIKQMQTIINDCKQDKYDLYDEWNNLFFANIHTNLVKLWYKLTEYFDQNSSELLIYSPFLSEFGKIIQYFNYKFIFTNPTECNLPNWTKFLQRSFDLLVNPLIILQLYGYQMLSILVDGLIEIDSNTIDTNTFSNCLSLEHFKDCLVKVDGIVNELLQGFKLCDDCCQVEPHTDSYTYIFAYLNLWNIFLQLCGKSSPELRYQYADWYRKNDILKHYLENLFKLMPSDIFTYNYNNNNNTNNNSTNNENKLKLWRELFKKSPNLSFNQLETYTSEKLEHYSCWLYTLTLLQLPAVVRQWWSETETKISQIVERITTFYVSPRLCDDELIDVSKHETKFKNMVIKVLPQVREVVAIYTVDEAQMELVITLPPNYPLKGPDVQCNRQIGGTSHKQWLMQLKKCLLHQNGRIWDALSLWNSNLDKKFDGIEECYICFAVLHPGTYQLPKLSCRTCKKKFHSACLYKWFSTSNKSTCPICRNLF